MKYYFESERLILRQFTAEDAQPFHQMTRDEDIQRYVPYVCGFNEEATYRSIEKDFIPCDFETAYHVAIEEKATKELIGAIFAISLDTDNRIFEMCILTSKPKRKQGFMYEALCTFKYTLPKETTLSFSIAQGNIASYQTVSKFIGKKTDPFLNSCSDSVHFLSITV